jgi:hypothetical protein
MISSLGSRVHLFVRPDAREAFTSLFRDVLKCKVVEHDFGMEHPILLVDCGNASAFSVEFSELAPQPHSGTTLDDEQAFRGAWIEFGSANAEATRKALRSAGIPEFRHPGSAHAYFSAPGGQVFRILELDYAGP